MLLIWTFLLTLPFALTSAYALRHWYEVLGSISRLAPDEEISSRMLSQLFHPWAAAAASLVQSFTVTPLAMALVIRTVVQTHLGQDVGAAAGLRGALRLVPRILWILVLQFLLLFSGGFALGIVAGVMVAAAPHSGIVISIVVVGALVAVALSVVISVRWSLSVVSGVVEERHGAAALRRSWGLSKGSAWKLFGNMLVIGLLLSVAASIVALVPRLGVEFHGGSWWIALGLVNAAIAGISIPVINTARTLLYVHCRVRGEGLSLDQLERGLRDDASVDPLPLPPA